ncbi:glycosyltransferase [Flavobacterium pectinovorum]|jgi:glycosyltransferase involved in cell wall biosynthesis|uniref:Glycosyltransferase n=1 Tax=Flavobacterium pectinovorum TaxID=29533 RepID=A0A502EUK8_9FLAO|nr:glycosyltransferase [Flavobacterium pectinovorum]TPG40116.1 glycosyltransferase [Flavobacterium pectinovorum]
MLNKKKILIIGPIGDFGGRELETAYIANVLSSKYDVAACTTGNLSSKSQVFDFNKKLSVFSLKELLCQKYFGIKLLAYLSYYKNKKKGSVEAFANNKFAKKHLNYENRIKVILDQILSNYDMILIVAQLSSAYIEEIIKKSQFQNKKIIFRTTGCIQDNQDFSFLNKVHLFLHHSENNAKRFKITKHNYKIIDQCAFNETELLEIPTLKNKVKVFLTIARIEKEKNIDVVIKAFLKSFNNKNQLIIVGDGTELSNLKEMSQNNNNIQFTGFVSNKKVLDFFKISDCLIISHYDLETGPLTGVEAMASGRLILSAKTGAMQERLLDYDFFFDNTLESLTEQMNKISSLENMEVSNLSQNIREKYENELSNKIISKKYIEAIDAVFKICE